MRLELGERFYDDPRILVADRHSKQAVGLFVRSLSFMAENGWDPSPGSSRCFPEAYGWMFLHDAGSWPKTRRPFNALEKADLWVSITNRKGKRGGGWWMPGVEELWRIRPLREPIAPSVRKAVLDRDGRECQICGEEIPLGDVIHLDHIVPVSHYGRSTIDNLQVSHATCNLKKGARV